MSRKVHDRDLSYSSYLRLSPRCGIICPCLRTKRHVGPRWLPDLTNCWSEKDKDAFVPVLPHPGDDDRASPGLTGGSNGNSLRKPKSLAASGRRTSTASRGLRAVSAPIRTGVESVSEACGRNHDLRHLDLGFCHGFGRGRPMILGQAVPETAWCEETRDGQPFDPKRNDRLSIPGSQLLALEQQRQGRGSAFTLEIRGNSHGPNGIRTFDETTHMPVNVSEWARVLREANGADVLLVGVVYSQTERVDSAMRSSIDLVRRANEHLCLGHYSAAVAECHLAIEACGSRSILLRRPATREAFVHNMNGQLSMTKRDRASRSERQCEFLSRCPSCRACCRAGDIQPP